MSKFKAVWIGVLLALGCINTYYVIFGDPLLLVLSLVAAICTFGVAAMMLYVARR